MRTKQPFSTISYNTLSFLQEKLNFLFKQKKISNYIFVYHYAEEDEACKNHTHLYIEPNKLLDTLDLEELFIEFDPNNPKKPLKCINFQRSDIDEWILYCSHYPPYLASKLESRNFTYDYSDFYARDEDTFYFDWAHAFKGSKWALRNSLLQQLSNNEIAPHELINNGTFPLNMASQLNAYEYMKKNYGKTTRNFREGHE